MKYYRVIALIALVVVTLLSACGHGAKGISLCRPSITPDQSPYVTSLAVSGLRPELHFTYSLTGHPSASGFTVVAMENDYVPKPATEAPYSISVKPGEDGSKQEAVLSATGQRTVLAHFRYDPARWEIAGVASSNCWPGIKDFLPLVAIAEPGVLVISNMPVGAVPTTCAEGTFATIVLQPVGKNAATIPIFGDTSLNVIWLNSTAEGHVQYSEGTLNFRADGMFGDADSRDGDITGSELTDTSINNQLHNLEFVDFGNTFSTALTWRDLPLSFSESFAGDYDNNGIVNIGDQALIGENFDPGTGYYYQAQRGVREVGESSIWLNLKRQYLDTENIEFERELWYWGNQHINAFWYYDHDGWTDPTDYQYTELEDEEDYRPATDNVNNLDGNFDGLVRDYLNYNTFEDAYTCNGFWDEPTLQKWHPGDNSLVARYYGCALTGYLVYVHSYPYNGPDPGFNPDSPNVDNDKWVRTFYRYPGTIPVIPGSPTPIPYIKETGDAPLAKLNVNTNLTQDDFPGMCGPSNKAYDIYIYPYYCVNNVASRGPVTKLEGAYNWVIDNADPYFVKPTGPASESLEKVLDPENSTLTDFNYISYSLDGHVLVYFYPAIDPPSYSGNDNINYHCYYSLNPFTRADLTRTDVWQKPVLSCSYNSNYSDTGNLPLFCYSNLYFELDNAGTPLLPGQTVYFLILAEDLSNHLTDNVHVYHDSARTVDQNTCIVLANGLSEEAASVVGDIIADPKGISLSYPSAYIDDDDSTGDIDETEVIVDYRRLQAGLTDPPLIDSNITAGIPYKPYPTGMNTTQLGLAHQTDEDGYLLYSDSPSNTLPIPMMTYNAFNAAFFGGSHIWLTTMTCHKSAGNWLGNYVDHENPVFGMNFMSTGTAIHSFTFGNSSDLNRKYILAYNHFNLQVDKQNPEVYKSSLFVETGNSPSSWNSATQLYLQDSVSNNDIVIRSSLCSVADLPLLPGGTGPGFPSNTTMPTNVERTCYMLVSTDEWTLRLEDTHGDPVYYYFDEIVDLWKTTDATTWDHSELADALPYNGTNPARGPNSLAAVVGPEVDGHYVYVTYVDSETGETPSSDNRGLRIAYAIDSTSGLTQWNSPGLNVSGYAGLIDDSFRAHPACRYDQVDLAVKPNSLVSSTTFNALGCAYFDQYQGRVKLAETLGTGLNATWIRQPYGPGGINDLDEGQILWVKLAYYKRFDNAMIPYILYARRIAAGDNQFQICLWYPNSI